MKTIFVNNFSEGIADSNYSQRPGQFSITKHFDINAYPNRLVPHRALETDQTDQTAIGHLIVASDGLVYGLGTDPGNPTFQEIYKKADSTTAWDDVANTLTGKVVNYNTFVEYKNYFYTLDANRYVMRFDRTGAAAINTTYSDLTSFTYNAQGVVHPKDDILYIPYNNKIWSLNTHAGTPTVAALTVPSNLTITAITPYGNYLAIAAVPTAALTTSPAGGGFKSTVYLWDRNSSLATLTESIDWGTGVIRILNVLDGVLLGVAYNNGATTEYQDRDSIVIKGYNLATPYVIKELSTTKQTTTSPVAGINTRVNFIYRDKLYISIKLFGGSTSPTHYGVWTIGKSKQSGSFVVNLERMATNDATETDVLAAAAVGDVFYTVHTAVGTITRSVNESAFASVYAATSIYESLINPSMSPDDYYRAKNLAAVACYYTPLITSAQVVVKYRVDGGSWITVFTDSTDGSTGFEIGKAASGMTTDGRYFEFRVESTGGAEIIALAYKYEIKPNLL